MHQSHIFNSLTLPYLAQGLRTWSPKLPLLYPTAATATLQVQQCNITFSTFISPRATHNDNDSCVFFPSPLHYLHLFRWYQMGSVCTVFQPRRNSDIVVMWSSEHCVRLSPYQLNRHTSIYNALMITLQQYHYFFLAGREFSVPTLRSETLPIIQLNTFHLHQGERLKHSVKTLARFPDLNVGIREL